MLVGGLEVCEMFCGFICIVSWGWVFEYVCEGCDWFYNLVLRFIEMGYIINIGVWLIKEIIVYLYNLVFG